MSDKKKVLFICQYFYPEKVSSGVLPYELAAELAKNNYKVTALVGKPKEYIAEGKKCSKKEVYKEIEIHRISYIGANRKKKIGRIVNMIGFSLSVLLHPLRFISNDIYISFTNPPILPMIVSLYAKIFRKKVIFVIYDLYPDSPIKLGYLNEHSLLAKLFDKINRFCFHQADKIVAISSEMKRYIMQSKNICEDKIAVIPNWYADDYHDYRYSCDLPLKIVYGGNMGIAQDMETIMQTAILLKDDSRFEFIFAGHGSKKEYVENTIKESGLHHCQVYDFLPKEEYDALLKQSHMAILSLNENICGLGSPSKYYGYLALKKPIIAIMPNGTDVYHDIDTHHIGIHIHSGEEMKLKEELVEIVNHLECLCDMSDRAYRLFQEEYTLEKSSEKYSKLIEEVLK